MHREHGHLQEVILQNFVPHPRYYGAEPAEIADEAQRSDTHGEPAPLPGWATPVSLDDMRVLVRECRRLMPDVGIQIPPNLSDWWLPLVEEGATDLGGLSANGDHISPEHPFPSVHRMRKQLQPRGYALTERLCVYPQYMDPEWMEQGVLDVVKLRFWSFIPRRGSGRREERPIRARPGAGRDRARPRRRRALARRADRAVRGDAPGGDRGHAPGGRRAARRAGRRHRHVRRQPQHQRLERLRRRAARSAASGRASARPTPTSTRRPSSARRVREAVEFGATEICMQSGIHPDWTIADYEHWLRVAKDEAPEIHLHAYSPMEVDAMAGDLPLDEVFARLRDAGLGSTPGTAAEVLHDGVRERISPNKLPVGRWVEVIEACHAAGVRSTVTVMFGHIEEPWELAEHMRVVRELQERTGGFTEFVPLSFIPFHTLLGRTHGIEPISREENLKHTAAFRLALGKTIPSLQASWVKMGLDAATEALRWGVNDLGGTLMEESISRMAGSEHGVRLDPEDLIGAAWAAGRPAAERDTLYGIRRRYELPVAA